MDGRQVKADLSCRDNASIADAVGERSIARLCGGTSFFPDAAGKHAHACELSAIARQSSRSVASIWELVATPKISEVAVIWLITTSQRDTLIVSKAFSTRRPVFVNTYAFAGEKLSSDLLKKYPDQSVLSRLESVIRGS